jgi:hypothetical protein
MVACVLAAVLASALSTIASGSPSALVGSRLAGRWVGFEQRFHASSGQPLPVPEEYTPSSDLEWGTVPFGFQTAIEFDPTPAADGSLGASHTRQLLWCGCFIEGPSQTAEPWRNRRVPVAALPPAEARGLGWAAQGAVDFAPLPLPFKGALRILELQGQTPRLAELGLLAPCGEALCVLLLAHSEHDGRLLLPVIATFLERDASADGAAGKALAKRLGEEAKRAAALEEGAPAASASAGATVRLGDGATLAIEPGGEQGSFVVRAHWRGAALIAHWRAGALTSVDALSHANAR